jgi:hypothetical protein
MTIGISGGLVSAHAAAQQPPAPPVPQVQWLNLGRPGDSSGGAGYFDRTGALQLAPLRLMLLGNHPPHPSTDPYCWDLGTTSSAKAAAFNLLGTPTRWSAPRLTLFGFSRDGCVLDRAIGGGVAFVVPMRQDIFFVASGGAIYLPAGGPFATPTGSAAARTDVVFARPDGRSFNIGVSTTRGVPRISFGGIF